MSVLKSRSLVMLPAAIQLYTGLARNTDFFCDHRDAASQIHGGLHHINCFEPTLHCAGNLVLLLAVGQRLIEI